MQKQTRYQIRTVFPVVFASLGVGLVGDALANWLFDYDRPFQWWFWIGVLFMVAGLSPILFRTRGSGSRSEIWAIISAFVAAPLASSWFGDGLESSNYWQALFGVVLALIPLVFLVLALKQRDHERHSSFVSDSAVARDELLDQADVLIATVGPTMWGDEYPRTLFYTLRRLKNLKLVVQVYDSNSPNAKLIDQTINDHFDCIEIPPAGRPKIVQIDSVRAYEPTTGASAIREEIAQQIKDVEGQHIVGDVTGGTALQSLFLNDLIRSFENAAPIYVVADPPRKWAKGKLGPDSDTKESFREVTRFVATSDFEDVAATVGLKIVDLTAQEESE